MNSNAKGDSVSERALPDALSYASDVGFLGILQAVTRLRGLILLPVIASSMGAAAYGVWTQSLAVVLTGSAVISFQLPVALVRFVSGRSERSRQRAVLMPQLMILSAVGVAVTLAAFAAPSSFAAVVFGDPDYATIASWLGLWIAIAAIGSLALDFQRALHHIKLFGLLTTGQVIVQLVLVAGVTLQTKELELAVLAAVSWEAVFAVGVLFLGVRDVGWGWPGLGTLRESLEFSLPLVPSYYGSVVLSFADRMLIAWQLGPTAVGIYSAAYSLARVVGEIFRPVKAALVPAASRLWDRSEVREAEWLLTNTLRYYMLLALPAVVGAALVGPGVLTTLANEVASDDLGWIVALLAVGFVFNNLQSTFGVLLQLERDTRPLAISKVVAAGAFLILIGLWVPRWGLMGGAVATASGYGLDCLITSIAAWRRHPITFPSASTAKAVVATGVMGVLVSLVMTPGVFALLGEVLVGVIGYILTLVVLRGIGGRELKFFWSILSRTLPGNIDSSV